MSERALIKELLGKEIQDLDFQDVSTFFQRERKESDLLEFKSYGIEKGNKDPKEHLRAVQRTICAFLNSEGGVLIWGSPLGERRDGAKEKVFVGDLTSVQVDLEEDQLSDGILQSISPMPSGIRFRKLTHGVNRIYVFEVPRSSYSPHQIKGTYYARFTAQTHPAPHYLVEALMRRISFPNIGAYFKPTALQAAGVDLQLLGEVLVINHSPLQNEREVTIYLTTSQGHFGGQAYGVASNRKYLNGNSELRLENHIATLHYGVIHREVIEIRMPIAARGSILKLTVSAGGLNSPLKGSTYLITLDTHLGAKNLIRSMTENYEFHETLGDMRSSSSAVLQQALGR